MFRNFKRYLSNTIGWRTNRKIIVIESDDWGSIRMPSLKVFESLKAKGLSLENGDSRRYNTNDTLASNDDLIALFNTLTKFKDIHGNHLTFTPISLVANPDFEKIRNSNFNQYYYEPFHVTLNRYYSSASIFDLWKEGISNKIFVPQFHGREHLNTSIWMQDLQNNNKETHLAFDYNCWCFNNKNRYGISYQAAFELNTFSDLEIHTKTIDDGLALFEDVFGYKAVFFVPPNGPINNLIEKIASSKGIKYMSSSKIQKESLGEGKTRKVYHYLGQTNNYGQKYITRNCFFEPSSPGKDWVNSCLKEIEIAFQLKKPAVISSHRVNYIGALNENNRKNGLFQLTQLITEVHKRWPNVEFLTSEILGKIMNNR